MPSVRRSSVTGDVQAGDAPATSAPPSAKVIGADRPNGSPSSRSPMARACACRHRASRRSRRAALHGGRLPGQRSRMANAPSHCSPTRARAARLVEVSRPGAARQATRSDHTDRRGRVRGTQYRVGFDEGANRRTHADVIDASCASMHPVPAPICGPASALTDTGGKVAIVAPLLEAPYLSTLPDASALRSCASRCRRGRAAAGTGRVRPPSTSRERPADRLRRRLSHPGLDDAQWYLRARRVRLRRHRSRRRYAALRAEGAAPSRRRTARPRANAKQRSARSSSRGRRTVDAPRARVQVAGDPRSRASCRIRTSRSREPAR